MNIVDKTIAFSNGKWVSAKALVEHLGVESSADTSLGTSNLANKRDVSFQTQKNAEGDIIWYRAFSLKGKSAVELAKLRKSLGILVGMESIKMGGAA